MRRQTFQIDQCLLKACRQLNNSLLQVLPA
nr:MAG TPA: hypothetical protein [Caudoviricetes sp.]